MAKTAIVVITEGSEEMEATITIDLLRRAGVEVTVAGLEGAGPVTCSRGVKILPDVGLSDVEGPADVFVLPGGAGGAQAFAKSEAVKQCVLRQLDADRAVAAICAAPMAFAAHDLFGGRKMTCHPSVKEIVEQHAEHQHDPVVTDRDLITSQGPGTAFHFGLAIIEHLLGPEKAAEVRAPLMMPL